MSKPLLSLLIPTVVGREDCAAALRKKIIEQVSGEGSFMVQFASATPKEGMVGRIELGEVEILDYKDNKEMTIGEKRELLYSAANALYSLQIDDDDSIADDAISLILQAIKENPDVDCITFQERVRLDGVEFKSNHSLSYSGWQGDGSKELSDGFHFWRTPFFKSVIKTEIAKSVPIPHCRWGEDNMWADELCKVLKTEHHINKQLYYYDYISSPHNERYGIKS